MSTKNNITYMVASRDTNKYSIRVITSSEEEAREVWNREYPKFEKKTKSVNKAILLVKLFDLTSKDIQILEDSKADIKVAAENDLYIQRLVDKGDCLEYYEPEELEESMNEATYVYIVHSDINENNIYAEFATEEEAIDYARRNKDELTYVDKVEAALDEEGDIIEMFDSETIWVYDEEDDFELEEEVNEFDTDFEGEHPLDEGINLRNDAERKEFFRLCDEIGIYTGKDIVSFKKEVGCTDENILQALRDYRAELGPDFKIANPELEKEMAKKYEGIDFDALVEELEENEDMVECKECFDLVAKESCTKGDHGYVCEKCNKSLDEEIKGDVKLYNCFFDGDYVGDVYAENEMEAYAEMEETWPEYCYTFCDGIATVELADEEDLEEEVQDQSVNLEEDKSYVNSLELVKETVDKKGHDYWVYGGSGYVARCIEIVKEGDNYVANEYVSTESGRGDTDPEYITDSTDFKEVIKVLLDENFFDVEDRTYQEITREEA